MTGGQVFDRRDGRMVTTSNDARDAHAYADRLNRMGHTVRADLPPGPGNRARYVSQTISPVGWIAALQRRGWWVEADTTGCYEAHRPETPTGPTLLGLAAHLTEGDAWQAARRWHNDPRNGLLKASEPKL